MFRPSASRPPFFWGTVLALCAAFAGQSLASTPAAAAPAAPVSGYSVVERAGTFNSVSAHSVSAPCPRGKVVLAGGARIVNGGQRVLLRASYPVRSLFGDRWIASAEEVVPGTSANWQIRSYAVCANRPAGLTYKSVTSGISSGNIKFLPRVDCPGSTRLIGLGARIAGAGNRAGLNSITITSGLSASARASEAVATDQRWSVTSHAVCARALDLSFRESGWKRVGGPAQSGTAVANCPRGSKSFGVGVRLSATNAILNRLVPVGLRPTATGSQVTVSEPAPGTPGTWYLKAQVLCAR